MQKVDLLDAIIPQVLNWKWNGNLYEWRLQSATKKFFPSSRSLKCFPLTRILQLSHRMRLVMVTFERLWRSMIGLFNNKYPFLSWFPFPSFSRRFRVAKRKQFLALLFLQSFIIYCLENESFKRTVAHWESTHGASFVSHPRRGALSNCLRRNEERTNFPPKSQTIIDDEMFFIYLHSIVSFASCSPTIHYINP